MSQDDTYVIRESKPGRFVLFHVNGDSEESSWRLISKGLTLREAIRIAQSDPAEYNVWVEFLEEVKE